MFSCLDGEAVQVFLIIAWLMSNWETRGFAEQQRSEIGNIDRSGGIMSKVQGGMKCVKYLLFVFNFIFWLSGLLVLAVGLWLRFDPETVELLTGDDAPDTFFIAVYILLGAGGLMMVVGFFGCFGAVRESQCLLASFFACLLIIFGAEIAAGVFGFINKEQIVEEVQKFYSTSIADVSTPNGTAIASIYHKTLNCCGGSTSDTTNALCAEAEEDVQDCLTAITDFFNDKLHIVGFTGIGVAGVMIIGMIFSMVLCCAIRNNREVI
ncbi:tetraspanin-2-like [Lycodopsis pacificus]